MEPARDLDRRRDVAANRDLRERLATAGSSEDRAMVLAENTDLSPNQAEDLIARCGEDLDRLAREALGFKAEG